MQKIRVPISSFQFGEVSDSLITRTDTAIYNSSAQRLENMVVMAEGSVKKRYGTKFIYDFSNIDYVSTFTITVTDYANIATGTIIRFYKPDGTLIKVEFEASSSAAPSSSVGNTHYVRAYTDNNTTADNLFNTINAIDGFTVSNPAANVVTVSRDDFGSDYQTVLSSDQTRLAVTDVVDYPNQIRLFPFVFDGNEQYVIALRQYRNLTTAGYVQAFRLTDPESVSWASTNSQDVNGNDLPWLEEYLNEYTSAQFGDVMFVCHPLFAPRLITRTNLTSFEVSTFSFDQRADGKKTYQPYSKFQDFGVTLDPSGTDNVADDDAIATAQDVGAGGSFSLVGGGTVTLTVPKLITIESGGDDSSITFNISGTNAAGSIQSELVTGTNAGTATSTRHFKTVTGVQAQGSGDPASGAKVGVITGVTLTTSANYWDVTGSATNGNYASSLHVGAVVRYGGNEITISSVQSLTQATGDVVEELSIRLKVLNPFRTNDQSNKVEVTQLNHGYSGGESITISDAADIGGITVSNLNGSRTVGDIIDDNTYNFTAGGTANASADGGGSPKITTHAATTDWDEQAWSAKRGYPAAVEFHQNRLCFGGTIAEPDHIWMSKIGSFFNFDVGDAEDTDSISMVAATGEVNEIRYMVSNRDLQIFTASNEIYIPTFQNQAITPTNAQIKKQTPYGADFVEPMAIDGATIFLQNSKQTVREYLFADSENAYISPAISTIASHLIKKPRDLAVVHSGFGLPDSYAAFCLSDGDMALFSSNRAEKKASWSRVSITGAFNSVTAIEDRLFAHVYDVNHKSCLVEFINDIGLDIYIYAAISSNVADVSAWYNSGDVVDVIATDGSTLSSLGQFTVNGSEQVDMSAHSSSDYTHIYAGKKFTAKLVTNPIDVTAGNGPTTGEIRGITNVVVDMKNTKSAKINSRPLVTTSGFTGKKEFRLLGYDRNPQVTIEQDHPLDMQINGLVAELIL